jgi:transcriptional regulator with GAF, ATPase, and Fis domain
MQSVRDVVAKVAGANITVLLLGESGVGKELVAHALHHVPPRASHPFLKVNCAALPEDLLESELFGHERGAFTGAYRGKPGKFELAQHGTIFLDEIGEIPLRLQAKLLHILQDGEFARVGGQRILQSDVRVIAATNRDLEAAVRAGRFREDLYYRLNVIVIRIPPLRDRPGEIPVLADHFLRQFNMEYGRSTVMSAETRRAFTDYAWPGNIRELENAVRRMVVLGSAPARPEPVMDAEAGLTVPARASFSSPPTGPMSLKTIAREAAREAEVAVIMAALDRVKWNRTKAARLLRVSYRTLLYKIGGYGLARLPAGDTERFVA